MPVSQSIPVAGAQSRSSLGVGHVLDLVDVSGGHQVEPHERGEPPTRFEGQRALDRSQPPEFGLQIAVEAEPDRGVQVRPDRAAGRTDIGEDTRTASSGPRAEHVGIGGRVDAAVDVLHAADGDRAEVSGDGAGRDTAAPTVAGGASARPNTTRRPSRRPTATIQVSRSGQLPRNLRSKPSLRKSVAIRPAGSRPMARATGRARNGPISSRRARGGATTSTGAAAAADGGRQGGAGSAGPKRGGHDGAGRGADQDIRVARVPAELRRALSTPRWNASPATPPAPRTNPTCT